jgi:fibronectin type 3 domain-containing protein
MRSLILPLKTDTPGYPVQLFYSEAIPLVVQQTASTNVNVGTVNALAAIPIGTTDDADAAALIQQINNAIESSTLNAKIVGNPTASSIPALNSATPDYGQITLAWTADSNYSYNIYRSSVSGSGYFLIGSAAGGSTSYVDSISIGTTWYYVIRGASAGGRESANSAEVNATLLIPATPTGLAATANPYQSALAWTAVTPAGGSVFTQVYYSIYKDGGSTPIATTTTNFYNDSGVTDGLAHTYTVSAVINGIEGSQCGSVSCTPTLLAAPVASVAQSAYANSLTVSWGAVTGATKYNLYRSNSSGTETLYKSGISALSFVDDALSSGQTFFYTVTATVNGGESAQSTEVSATPAAVAFTSVSTNPSPIYAVAGGTVTLVGTGIDASQNGAIHAFGSLYVCDYSVAGQVTIPISGVTPATVELLYQVGGYDLDTGKSVVFN